MDFSIFNVPITTEEMIFAAQIFQAQITNKSPVPELFGKDAPDDGKSYLMLKNIPMNRAQIALLEAFKDDTKKASAMGFRLMALGKFIEDSRAQKWVRTDEDGGEVLHYNIFTALAKYKITKDDKANANRFFKELEKLGEPEADEAA